MSLPTDENEAIRILDKASGLGINFFDTADVYNSGQNEIVVGKAFKEKRKDIVLATKVGNVPKADGSTGFDWNPSKKHILDSAEKSLKRLQTDYIDLYQLHGGTIQDNIDETIEAFEQLVQDGKIRYYGISSIRPNVIREYIKKSSIVSVMMQYSLLDRRPEEECLDMLHNHNISVLSRGALAQGLLAGKPAKPYLGYSAEEVKKAAEAVKALSDPNRSSAQTAIRYVLQHQALASAVLGIRTVEHLEDVVGAVEAAPLTAAEIKELQNTVHPLIYADHRL